MNTLTATATPWREAAEQRLEQRGDGGLAEKADADRRERDPELAGREVLGDVVERVEGQRGRRRGPPRPSVSTRARRARTSANSAATKKPLISTRTRTATSSSALKRCSIPAAPRRAGRRYFEEGRRRSSRRPGER